MKLRHIKCSISRNIQFFPRGLIRNIKNSLKINLKEKEREREKERDEIKNKEER